MKSATDMLIERLRDATNLHDLDALADCFHPDYDSAFPAHPERSFRGHEQMRMNWTSIFAAVPDLKSTLVRRASSCETAWAEWEWTGTRRDGNAFIMRGVTIQEVRHGKVAWARLYMEPVLQPVPGAEPAIRQLLGEPSGR